MNMLKKENVEMGLIVLAIYGAIMWAFLGLSAAAKYLFGAAITDSYLEGMMCLITDGLVFLAIAISAISFVFWVAEKIDDFRCNLMVKRQRAKMTLGEKLSEVICFYYRWKQFHEERLKRTLREEDKQKVREEISRIDANIHETQARINEYYEQVRARADVVAGALGQDSVIW